MMQTIEISVRASVHKAYTADHRRMRATLAEAIEACGASDGDDARSAFSELSIALRAHMRAEDEVLFVAFEAATGLYDAGPTAVMRREHREIEKRLDQIEALLRTDAALATVELRLQALRALLADHDVREERILYPACDRLLSEHASTMAAQALANSEGEPS